MEAARANAQAGPGEPKRFAWADRVFTAGVQRVNRYRDGEWLEVDEPQTVEQTLRANKTYLDHQQKYADQLDQAARDEYLMAMKEDKELNDSAVGILQASGGHRRNKFTRRLYRAWLAAQSSRLDAGEGPVGPDDRAAVFGGRAARTRRTR